LFYPQTVFIPAKEMLSHAKGLISMKKKYGENMPFDISLLDIIEKAQAWKLSEMPELAKRVVASLERIIDGVVEVKEDGSFWMKKTNGDIIPFAMEADGLKRLGLIWQLLMNEGITKDSVILWDEPEASINPELLPLLADILHILKNDGVQIFLATHNYMLAKYIGLRKQEENDVLFISLRKNEEGEIKTERANNYSELKTNPIENAEKELFNAVVKKSMEG